MKTLFISLLMVVTCARISYADPLATLKTSKAEIFAPILFGAYSISAIVDVSLTQYGLGKGIVYEANPVQRYFTDRGPVVSGIAKGSMHFAIGYFLFKRKDSNPKAVMLSLVLLTAANIAVDISNNKQINR